MRARPAVIAAERPVMNLKAYHARASEMPRRRSSRLADPSAVLGVHVFRSRIWLAVPLAIASIASTAPDASGRPASSEAAGPRVRVLGRAAHVEARVTRDAGKVSLSGAVVDDAGRPVAGARVVVSLSHASSPTAAAPPVAVPLSKAFPGGVRARRRGA